jgi:hypothetical protein
MLNAIQQIEKSFPFKIHPAADFLVMLGKLPSDRRSEYPPWR